MGVMTRVEISPTFEAWQAAARRLLLDRVPPTHVTWVEGADGEAPKAAAPVARVPRKFLDLARQVAGGQDAARWSVLYEALSRIVHERSDLLDQAGDRLVRRLVALAARARREAQVAESAEALKLEAEGAGAAAFVPPGADLAGLQEAARRCRGCDLYRHATQMVFGAGPALDRARIYVTNAVKHFKFVSRGKRRIHDTPRITEVTACRPWLEAELGAIRPRVLGALGATAARAIFGADFRLMRDRGRFVETRWAPQTIATLHPSAVLRGEDEAAQQRLYRLLADDLKLIAASP